MTIRLTAGPQDNKDCVRYSVQNLAVLGDGPGIE